MGSNFNSPGDKGLDQDSAEKGMDAKDIRDVGLKKKHSHWMRRKRKRRS